MGPFRKRLWLSLLTGYMFLFYGELVFWSSPDREGMEIAILCVTWIVYSFFAYVFLCVAGAFRARSPLAVFLAGAVFGWFEEGIVLQTMHGSPDTPFPMSIPFTGLAWHALVGAFAGWYWTRRILSGNAYGKTAALAIGTGAFYGLWAVFWWTEPPEPMGRLIEAGRGDLLLAHFAVFAMASGALLVLAHWLYNRALPFDFKPSKPELGLLAAAAAVYFSMVTVPAAPRAVWVVPLTLGPTLAALELNRRAETRMSAIGMFGGEVRAANYFLLFLVPLTAIALYAAALAADARWRTNMVVYYLFSAIGVVLWISGMAEAAVRFARARRGAD